MGYVMLEEDHLRDIASAIRTKSGNKEKIKPVDMATVIENMSVGSPGGDLVAFVSFMSEDGSEELYIKPTIKGDDCVHVVNKGLLAKPTKESTNTINYTFSGFSKEPNSVADSTALKNITEDTLLYISFSESVRYYKVNFYDDETDTTPTSFDVTYGSDASKLYTPKKDGYKFKGWGQDLTNITSNTDVIALWELDDGIIRDSWDVVASNPDIYKIGDKKAVTLNYSDGSSETINFTVVDKNVTPLKNENSNATLTFMADNILKTSTNLNTSGNYQSDMHNNTIFKNYLTNTVFNSLPLDLQNVIKEVSPNLSVYSTKGDGRKIFICSSYQLDGSTTSKVCEGQPQSQFTYFKNGNSYNRKKLLTADNSYWTSTIFHTSNGNCYYVTNGKVTASASPSSATHGVVPCFCI